MALKTTPTKINFSATLMGADLHTVMVTQAGFSQNKRCCFSQINCNQLTEGCSPRRAALLDCALVTVSHTAGNL